MIGTQEYVLTRLSCAGVFKLTFLTAVCLCGIGGIILGLVEKQSVGLSGGSFLGLLFAFASAASAACAAAVFNLLTPLTGGITLQLEVRPASESEPLKDVPIEE